MPSQMTEHPKSEAVPITSPSPAAGPLALSSSSFSPSLHGASPASGHTWNGPSSTTASHMSDVDPALPLGTLPIVMAPQNRNPALTSSSSSHDGDPVLPSSTRNEVVGGNDTDMTSVASGNGAIHPSKTNGFGAGMQTAGPNSSTALPNEHGSPRDAVAHVKLEGLVGKEFGKGPGGALRPQDSTSRSPPMSPQRATSDGATKRTRPQSPLGDNLLASHAIDRPQSGDSFTSDAAADTVLIDDNLPATSPSPRELLGLKDFPSTASDLVSWGGRPSTREGVSNGVQGDVGSPVGVESAQLRLSTSNAMSLGSEGPSPFQV